MRRAGRQVCALAAAATLAVAGCSSGGAPRPVRSTQPVTAGAATPTPTLSPAVSPSTTHTAPRHRPKTTMPRPAPKTTTMHRHVDQARSLPLHLATGTARQVITVIAPSASSTTATLQAWRKVPGGWRKVDGAVQAHVGAAGVGTAHEGSSKTPAGSFTLTRAFGYDTDPGTALPYFRTTPADYWISTQGPEYNTHQRCRSCDYDNGVNERLFYARPFYEYAVVIDYNTRNAPGGVRQGAGSAFFLHVTDGAPTAGCVAIPADRLVSLMRWLDPDRQPRILIGTD